MRSVLKKCLPCAAYTLRDTCPRCGGRAGSPLPPRYSPEDRYGVYRRRLKGGGDSSSRAS